MKRLTTLLIALFSFGILNAQNCEIWDLIVETHPCENGTFLVDLDFNYEEVGENGFELYIIDWTNTTTTIDTFEYSELYLTLGPLMEGTVYEFVVSDIDFPDCSDNFEMAAVECPPFQDCVIGNICLSFVECNPNGTQTVILDFDHIGDNELGFDLSINNDLFEFFQYESLPLTIENFPITGNLSDIISICDNDNPDCCTEYTWIEPECETEDCLIDKVVFDFLECEDGMFWGHINFQYQNTSDSFSIVGSGMSHGTFAYADLPVLIGPLPGDGNTVWEFIVIDQDNPNCSSWTVIDPIDCGNGDCVIYNLEYDFQGCDGDDFFGYITFEYMDVSDSFTIQGNGINHGTFAYGELPIFIGPLPGDGTTVWEFVVSDLNNPGCGDEIIIDPVDCGGDCIINDLEVEFLECITDSTYAISINFFHSNTVGQTFDLFFDGVFFGYYSYSSLPLIVTGVPVNNNDYTHIEVSDNDNPDCNDVLEYLTPNCETNNECALFDMVFDFGLCDGGLFTGVIFFEYENTSDSFMLQGNGIFHGTFAYADLPVQIQPLPGDGETEWEFVAIDQHNPDCTTWTVIDPIECPPAITNDQNGKNSINILSSGNAIIINNEDGQLGKLFMNDLRGRLIKKWDTQASSITIDKNDLAPGVYWLSQQSQGSILTKSVVIW